MAIPKRWDIQIFYKNYWLSVGFHIDHTDPSLTLHLPFIILYIGRCKQRGFPHSLWRWLTGEQFSTSRK